MSGQMMNKPPTSIQTPTSNVSLWKAQQLRIDEEIIRATDLTHTRDLQYARNMLTRVNTLHTELLETIFAFCITPDLAHIHRISHVSRHWRALALAFPTLWRTIFLTGKPSPEFVRVNQLIQRSGARDLRLCVGPGSYDMVARVNLMGAAGALKHLAHHLHVTEFSDRPFLEMLVLLKFPMPVLTMFWLEAPVVYGTQALEIPDGTLAGDTPNLKRLKTTRCHPSPASPLIGGLTHLTIDASPSPRPTLADFHKILRVMPHLEELELTGFLPAQAIASSPSERLMIPRLARLALRGPFPECTALLSLISVPETARVAFTCQPRKWSHGITTQLTQFLTALADARQSGTNPFGALAPRKLCLALTYTTIELRALHPDTPSPEPLARLDFLWPLSEGRIIDAMLDTILSSIPLHDVHYLQLRNAGVVRSSVWAAQLPRLRCVRVLHHHGNPASPLGVLCSDIPSDAPLLPALAELALTQMPLGTAGDGDVQLRNVDLLAQWICARPSQTLHTLRLQRCSGMSTEMFNKFQSAVGKVTWDEV